MILYLGQLKYKKRVCQKLTDQAQLSTGQTRLLLGALSLLCLREIAILADYAQLDAQEIDCWFELQPQFFWLNRTKNDRDNQINNSILAYELPNFDSAWHEITGYKQPAISSSDPIEKVPHYAKVIGRTHQATLIKNISADNNQLIVDNANNSEVLTFAEMPNISLPYQRWLLQLAKISDIYLSRKRLKVAPEPVQAPSRPFVNFGFLDIDKNNTSSNLQSGQSNIPLWKNPVLILLLIVIGGLSIMAVGKYQYKKSQVVDTPTQMTKVKV